MRRVVEEVEELPRETQFGSATRCGSLEDIFLGGIWTEKGLGKAGLQITQSMSFSGQAHSGFSIKIVDFNQIPDLDP